MIQAAHFDIKSVTGLRQALVLSAEYENEPFPLEGYTLHGSIGTYPRMDLKCSVDENGRARIEWDSVPPGNWKYDVFLISAGNDETPLMEGTFTALPRITPVLDDESVNDEVGGVLHLPSGNEGTITLEVDGGFVSKEYAAIAKDAAEKAQQALEDIKQALQGVVTSIGGASGDILLDSGLKITGDREKGNVSLSLDDKTVVLTAGDQTIDGVKTFSSPPVIASAPASNNEAANKKYVDDMASKATGTTINGVSGDITLNLPMELDPDTKSMSVDFSGYASLQTDNVFEGGNTFMTGINGYVDSVTSTAILYATNVPGDSSSGHPVLTIEHIGSSNVRISSGTHLMLKARGGNIYAESIFTANGGVNVYGSALFNSGVTVSQYLKTSSLDAENVEASTINLVDSYDLSCIDLMPFYGSPDEASLIFHPAQTGPGTTDYDIQLYFTYGSSGGFADWLAGPSIQMMRFHPAIGFYNAVSYSNPVVFLGSATFSALLKAQQAEIDQLKINSPLYKEGFLAWQDAGGLSMTRPSITESLYDADNPKAMLNREDNDQRYLQVKSLTAAEYAALGSYSPTTLYRITDADPAAVYLGDLKLSVAAD